MSGADQRYEAWRAELAKARRGKSRWSEGDCIYTLRELAGQLEYSQAKLEHDLRCDEEPS